MHFFKEDIKRYFGPSDIVDGITTWKMIKKVLQTEPLWIMCLYRYRRWLHNEFRIPVIKSILKVPYTLLARPLEILLGVHISWIAEIGPGFYIGHFGSIWVGPVKIGRCCNISQEVTIGIGGEGEYRGLPEIGDNVYIGPGAKVFGRIKIGNNVAIGANSVVSKSLPANCTVVGNPGRIISSKGSSKILLAE